MEGLCFSFSHSSFPALLHHSIQPLGHPTIEYTARGKNKIILASTQIYTRNVIPAS